MIIFNAGVPRSGTVLVNAMIRTLLAQTGTGVIQTNPHGPQLPALTRQLRRQGHYRHQPVLVHTHSWDRDTQRMLTGDPHVLAFANYRDPRDVCVSVMALHELTFEDACQAVPEYFQAFEALVHALDAMVIPYEMLVRAHETHCFQIARRLGLWPGFDQVRQAVEKTSIERHRRIMQDVRDGRVADVTERENRHRLFREHRMTLISDRHIQSGAVGRWREELSEEQQEAANAAFEAILDRYGYEH